MNRKNPSVALQRFIHSVDAPDLDFCETLDLSALSETEGPDRVAAEDLLLRRAAEEDDWRVPPAIAAIGLERAVPTLRRRLPEARGRMRLALARALVELGALEGIDEIVAEMLDGGDRDEGISALAASMGLPSRVILAALARAALHHPSPEVRVNAGADLFYVSGKTKDPLAWKFRPIYLLVAEPEEDKRCDTFGKICDLVQLPADLREELEAGLRSVSRNGPEPGAQL